MLKMVVKGFSATSNSRNGSIQFFFMHWSLYHLNAALTLWTWTVNIQVHVCEMKSRAGLINWKFIFLRHVNQTITTYNIKPMLLAHIRKQRRPSDFNQHDTTYSYIRQGPWVFLAFSSAVSWCSTVDIACSSRVSSINGMSTTASQSCCLPFISNSNSGG